MTVFNHPEVDDAQVVPLPVAALSSRQVHVGEAWTVADVLSAGDADMYQTFALVDAEIESDISKGEARSISAAVNLLGLDDDGAIYYQTGQHVRWSDFLRAVEAGLFSGDPSRIVTYPYGVAGGPSPDGLLSIVQYLFENREEIEATVAAIVGGSTWVSNNRRRAIANRWRQQGLTAPRINEILGKLPQWDAEVFAARTMLTVAEACVAMTNAGYERGADGLWRLGRTLHAKARQQRRVKIERAAEAEPH